MDAFDPETASICALEPTVPAGFHLRVIVVALRQILEEDPARITVLLGLVVTALRADAVERAAGTSDDSAVGDRRTCRCPFGRSFLEPRVGRRSDRVFDEM